MKNTSSSVLSGFETGTIDVYGPTTYSPSASGWVTFNLSTAFVWDGTSNVLVEIVHNAGNGGNGSGTTTYCTTTTNNKTYYGAKDNVSGGISGFDALSSWTSSGVSTNGPNIRFGYSGYPVWSPITNLFTDVDCTTAYVNGTYVATVYARPETTTTYTASVSVGSCSTSDSVTYTINSNTYASGAWSGGSAPNDAAQTAIIDDNLFMATNYRLRVCREIR